MHPLLSGIFGVLVGGLIGHWLAIGRDKRKEINGVVVPLKQRLLSLKDELSRESYVEKNISQEEIARVRVYIAKGKYSQLHSYFTQYVDSYDEDSKLDDLLPIVTFDDNGVRKLSNLLDKMNDLLKLQ